MGLLASLTLSALFDTCKLMTPETFIGLNPIVHRLKLPGIESIHATPPAPTDGNDPDSTQHAEVFRYCRLANTERANEIPNRLLPAACEQVNDLPPPGFGDGIEYV